MFKLGGTLVKRQGSIKCGRFDFLEKSQHRNLELSFSTIFGQRHTKAPLEAIAAQDGRAI